MSLLRRLECSEIAPGERNAYLVVSRDAVDLKGALAPRDEFPIVFPTRDPTRQYLLLQVHPLPRGVTERAREIC